MKITKTKRSIALKISKSVGAWPHNGKWAVQNRDGEILISGGQHVPVRRVGKAEWELDDPISSAGTFDLDDSWFQCILPRDEYFHLYPAPDADGWIKWKGGECPVEKGTLVDVIWRGGTERSGVKALHLGGAGHQFWVADGMGNDIIAYRLHKPEQQKSTAVGDDETNLAAKEELEALEFEPTPTIEQLAAEYRNRKDYAERKQQEAEEARAEAEAKLAELVAAGKAVGLVLSVAAPEKPAKPYTGRFYNANLGESAVYGCDTNDVICDGCGRRWGEHYEDESYCKHPSERENA